MTFSTNRIDTRHFAHAGENPLFIYPNAFYDGSNDDIYLASGTVRFINVSVASGVTTLSVSVHDMFAGGVPVRNGASRRRYTITAAGAAAEVVDGGRSAISTAASTAMVAANRVWQKTWVIIAGSEQVSEEMRVPCHYGMGIHLLASGDTAWSASVGFEPGKTGAARYRDYESFAQHINLG